jgi:hypothetical protein
MFRIRLSWRESGLIALTVATGTVTATYPGGWRQLPLDLADYACQQKAYADSGRQEEALNAAIVTAKCRQEVQAAWLEQLLAQQLTLRQAAAEFHHLYASEPAVVCGLRKRFPDTTGTELMAVMICYKAADVPGVNEQRMEQLHEEFRREYGKPLPPAQNPFLKNPEQNDTSPVTTARVG